MHRFVGLLVHLEPKDEDTCLRAEKQNSCCFQETRHRGLWNRMSIYVFALIVMDISCVFSQTSLAAINHHHSLGRLMICPGGHLSMSVRKSLEGHFSVDTLDIRHC
uniref:Secreted protein n=1 Tax=Steinernema glaseri TaxID=37863 RepID=A0A1I7ZZA9_9BILA